MNLFSHYSGPYLKMRAMLLESNLAIRCLAAATAKSLQLCPTLCDPIDGSPPGSSVPGILQARILEWVAISFSNAWKWKVKVKSLNRVRLLVTPWTAAYQAPLSMGFSRQEYWIGLPFLPTGENYNMLFRFVITYSPPPQGAAAAAKSLQSCPTLWPHRWQPTRLPRPWDSPI